MIIDLDHPDIRINPCSTSQIGVQIGFDLGNKRLHPDSLTLSRRGLGEYPGFTVAAVDHLNQYCASACIALSQDSGKTAPQFDPPN